MIIKWKSELINLLLFKLSNINKAEIKKIIAKDISNFPIDWKTTNPFFPPLIPKLSKIPNPRIKIEDKKRKLFFFWNRFLDKNVKNKKIKIKFIKFKKTKLFLIQKIEEIYSKILWNP